MKSSDFTGITTALAEVADFAAGRPDPAAVVHHVIVAPVDVRAIRTGVALTRTEPRSDP